MSEPLPAPRDLWLAISGTLGDLAREAEDFGMALCGDPEVATRYLVQLQQIDRIAQSLREVARVLAADDPRAAVNGICLGDLRSALERADAC